MLGVSSPVRLRSACGWHPCNGGSSPQPSSNRRRMMGIPQITAVIAAPERMQRAVIKDGELLLLPIALIGYSNTNWPFKDHRYTETSVRPFTSSWYSSSFDSGVWEYEHEHSNRSRSGACHCAYPTCKELGVFDTSNKIVMEHLAEQAKGRSEHLAKEAQRKEKTREYQRRAKAKKESNATI
jgi:hypothetical protein